jgi:hypothetical protein
MLVLSVYNQKPSRFLERLHFLGGGSPSLNSCCAGFELEAWRCKPFANHLIEWLPDYALAEDELQVSHGNMYVKLQEAAIRIYTSTKYKNRGEVGEIALHAVCRDYFDTIPISPRVFYKSSSNDVIKSFDMVHARFPNASTMELWLGESKLYTNPDAAITDAIDSVNMHLEHGFLKNQKLLLGPQIPKTTPRYEEILSIFKSQTSLDKLINAAVFAIGIACESVALVGTKSCTDTYKEAVLKELQFLQQKIIASSLNHSIKIVLVYIPLLNKSDLVTAFDDKLKGLQS